MRDDSSSNGMGILSLYIFFVAIGLVMVILNWGDFWCMLKTPIDLNYVSFEQMKKNDYIQMETNAVVDFYANETKKISKFGITSDKKEDTARYYMIPLRQVSSNTDFYITVKAYAKEYDSYNTVANQTREVWNSAYDYNNDFAKVKIEGRIKKLDPDLITLQQQYFEVPEIKEYVDAGVLMSNQCIPFAIVPLNKPLTLTMMILGTLLIFTGTGFILYTTSKSKNVFLQGNKNLYGGTSYQSDEFTYGKSRGGLNSNKDKSTILKKEIGKSNYIYLNGVSYNKAELKPINDLIQRGRFLEAEEALELLGGFDDKEIGQIVKNWSALYHE